MDLHVNLLFFLSQHVKFDSRIEMHHAAALLQILPHIAVQQRHPVASCELASFFPHAVFFFFKGQWGKCGGVQISPGYLSKMQGERRTCGVSSIREPNVHCCQIGLHKCSGSRESPVSCQVCHRLLCHVCRN